MTTKGKDMFKGITLTYRQPPRVRTKLPFIIKLCEICKKEFNRTPYVARTQRFCSRICSGTHASKKRIGVTRGYYYKSL